MNARETENQARWGAPRQRADFALVLSASRVTPWACRVLSGHATATINSSLALGDDCFGPKRLAERSTASNLGTAATLRSTALARDGGSWKKLAKRRGPCWRVHVRAHTRLPSDYPLGDRSWSQVFVDEGERVPRELLPRCFRSGTPVEPCLEVLPNSRLLDGQISLSEWLPTDEPCRRRGRRGGRPLPRSIRTLVLAEQVPTRSRRRLAALASKS
jgi:hypothetical protein